MRIIAGEFRSRKLFTPPDGEITRPIPDRVKESIFGILRGHIEGSEVFDGFAGTGAIGLEALSRGAKRVVFVEQNRFIAQVLKKNVEALGVAARTDIVHGDTLGMGAIARCPSAARIIFLDPPYPLARDPLGWRRITSAMQELARNLTSDGFIIVRTPWPFFEDQPAPEPAAPARPKGKWKDKKDRWNKNNWDASEVRRTPREHEGRGKKRPSLLTGTARDEETPFGDEWEEIDMEEAQSPEPAPPTAESVSAAKQPHKPVDLKIPGLKGPETHIYRHTAVHLYART